VPAAQTPAAFEGTPVDLVIDALLGNPREDVDFSLSCTSLQPEVPNQVDARNPSPGLPSPDKFEWIKRKHGLSALTTANNVFDSDDSAEYAQIFDQRHKHHKNDGDAGHDHVRHSARDNNRDYYRHRDAVNVPSQPPQPSNLTQLGGGSLFRISLTTDDANCNGSLTQDDFKSWGELSMNNAMSVRGARCDCTLEGMH
jgi:hypothetical protein